MLHAETKTNVCQVPRWEWRRRLGWNWMKIDCFLHRFFFISLSFVDNLFAVRMFCEWTASHLKCQSIFAKWKKFTYWGRTDAAIDRIEIRKKSLPEDIWVIGRRHKWTINDNNTEKEERGNGMGTQSGPMAIRLEFWIGFFSLPGNNKRNGILFLLFSVSTFDTN